jgi:hypothetical protein
MRIAISGSHATGKSSVARAFAELRPAYQIVDEPYHIMISEGVLFSTPPSVEDFEDQLARSARLLEEYSGPDALFDRCPLDFYA